jgi:hypothetical protein
MNIKDLEKRFLKAKLEKKDLAIELTVPTRKATEIIIVKHENLEYKLDYYRNNYTDDLVLNRCKDIKILNAKVINFKM